MINSWKENIRIIDSPGIKGFGLVDISKNELGDYHIYTLNEKHDLGAKENITVRMYGPLDIG